MKKSIDSFKIVKLALSIVSCSLLSAQTIELSPVSVQAKAIQNEYVNTVTVITEEKAEERRNITMDEKLNADVSFSTTINAKGENSVSFRGLDFKNTRYEEDGIPLYATTSGIDMGFMMSSGDVSFNDGSGISSFGVSSMGGEVRIFQKMPKKPFESKFSTNISTNDQLYKVYVGSMVKDFYVQADASYYYKKSFTLSDSFEETPLQEKGERLNSDKEQKNISFKTGYFITDELHVAAKVKYSQSVHGISPNTTEDITNPSFFAYTRLDPKEMGDVFLYLDYDIADYELSARLYYDSYKDKFKVYADKNYDALHPFAQNIITYDDSRLGTVLKALRDKNSHKSAFVLLIEENEHKRLGGGINLPNTESKIRTLNTSLSDIWQINKNFELQSAVSYSRMNPTKASGASLVTPVEDKESFDGQLKFSYKTQSSNYYVAVAKKSRMPTMEEMFTFFPWRVSNPGLKPEESIQYTIGSKYYITSKASVSADIYYYDIKELIVLENIPHPTKHIEHYVNREGALHYGGELRLNVKEFYKQDLSFSYAYANAEDSQGDAIVLIPQHSLRVEDSMKFTRKLQAFFAYSFVGERSSLNSAVSSNVKEQLDPYHLLDMQVIYKPHNSTKLRVGVKNILDENYEFNYGYPTAGRSFYVGVEVAL